MLWTMIKDDKLAESDDDNSEDEMDLDIVDNN